MTSLGSSPMQRADATKIGHWMVRELDKLRANQGSMSETHQLKAARAIYSVAFREAARQVTIHCAERGELLSKIFAVHSELLDGLIAERERWQVAEAAAWAAQQQAAQATQLRAHVARMLLSATQVMVQDDGLRAAAEAPAATSGGSSAGSAGAVVAAAAEGPQPGSSSEQARLLTRTLQLAAGLGRPKAEDLLFELMSDEADALPAIGAQERLAAVDALVGRLEPPRRATWLAEHAQQLPPAEQHALLVALLRHMGVSRWAALLAEVLVELPVQQLASVLAPALVLIPQPAWLELLQELPDASQLQVLEGLLQTQQAEKWVPVVRAQLKSLPPSVAARLREEVEAGVSHATDLWRDGAQASVGAERAANELARRLMEAEARAAAAEARLRQIELAAVGSDDSHAPSRDVDQNPASPVKALSGPVQVTQLDRHAPVVCIFDIAAASLPSPDSESGATQVRDSGSDPCLVFTLLETGDTCRTRTLRNATFAYWHGELLQLPLPPGASPPLLCKVQLYGKDWKDDDDLLGTSKETPLERNGTCRVSGLRLGASGATVTFSYRWIDAVSGPVVLC